MMVFILLGLTGQEQSFAAELYTKYKTPMWYYALSLCHDESAADEVVQNAFVAILGKLALLEGLQESQRHAYISITVRRLALHSNTRQSMIMETDMESVDDLPDEGHASFLDRQLDRAILQHAIDRLPEEGREIIALRYGLDLPFGQIGRLLQIRPGAARMRAGRAIRRLHTLIGEDVHG